MTRSDPRASVTVFGAVLLRYMVILLFGHLSPSYLLCGNNAHRLPMNQVVLLSLGHILHCMGCLIVCRLLLWFCCHHKLSIYHNNYENKPLLLHLITPWLCSGGHCSPGSLSVSWGGRELNNIEPDHWFPALLANLDTCIYILILLVNVCFAASVTFPGFCIGVILVFSQAWWIFTIKGYSFHEFSSWAGLVPASWQCPG